MKKKLISLLLTLVMLVSLFSSFAVSASADATVTTVRLGSGETVLSLCQKAGIDYYAHKNLIMKLNGLTSEAQFSKLAVGTNIVLPVSNAAAVSLAGSAATTGTIAGTAATTTPGTIPNTSSSWTAGASTAIPAGDYVSYYLVGYTIQSGETIAGIYNNWGLSYKTYSNQILKLNNLKNFNSIPAGKTLTLPTTNPAMAQTVYTTVMAHVMRSGDSAYNIICSDYNLNYNQVEKQVQYLNNRTDLSQFRLGEIMYIPISGIVSATTTVVPGTGTGSGSTSSSATVNPSAANNLVTQASTNGSFSLLVDGVAATTAFAGKTVEVVATPNAGYALSGITVQKVGDSSSYVAVNGNKFVMPAYSVSVSCTFAQAITSNINIDPAVNGSVSAMVNSVVTNSATAGNLVTVKSIPATGFMLDHIRVTYNDYKDTIAVENGQFIMPTFPVTVSAIFKEDPSYNPINGHNIYFDAAHGTISAKVGADAVSSAKAGARVTLTITPEANYTLQALVVYYDNFKKTLDVEKSAFTMPDGPVTVVATFTPTADAAFKLTKVHNADGNISLTVDGKETDTAKIGQTVKISASSSKAHYNYIPFVFKTGDSSVTVPVAEDGTFTMPDYPVTVSVRFYIYRNIVLDASNGTNGWFNVVAAYNGVAYNKAGAGVELNVTVWGYNPELYAPGNVIVTYADGSVHTLDGTSFIMPDCDIRVRVNFNPVQKLIAHSITSPARVANSYTVGGRTLHDNRDYTETINVGEKNNVIVTPNCMIGYEVESIYYVYTPAGGGADVTKVVSKDPVSGRYQFQMPDKTEIKEKTNVHLYAKFREIASYAIDVQYNAENADHKMGTVSTFTSLGAVKSAPQDAKISLRFAPASGCSVDFPQVRVITKSGVEVELNRNDYTFFMPSEPVIVYVPFRSDMHTVKLALAPTPEGASFPKGFINALVNGVKYTDDMLTAQRLLPVSVREGDTVTIINESREGYILDPTTPILVKRVSTGVPITVSPVDGYIDRFTFQMPDDDVVVSAQYVDDMYTIVSMPSEHGTYEAPKQAAYSATEAVSITNISPERGYEVADILLSYIDHSGYKHERESIKNGSGYIDDSGAHVSGGFVPAGGGIPKSEVYIEVIFQPVRNPLTIRYLFDNTPDSTCNYSIDLTIDGKAVEGIQRGSFIASGYDDVLALDPSKPTQGILTGATVIATRQEFNKDENFDIVGMWVELNGKVVCPSDTKETYYFAMPYVDSRNTGDLVLYVRYAKHTDDGFNLVAHKAAGAGHNAAAEFKVDGNASTIAKINQEIVLTLTPDDYCCEIDTKVVMSYVNADNETVREEFTGTVAAGIVTVTIPAGTIPTLPKSAVNFGYTSTPEKYSISCYDQDGNFPDSYEYYIDGEKGDTSPIEAPWGSAVKIAHKFDGYVIQEIEVIGDGSGDKYETNDGFIFVMPQESVTVTATVVPATYKLNVTYSGNGTGSAIIKVGDRIYNNGDQIPYDSEVTLEYVLDEATESRIWNVSIPLIYSDNSMCKFKMPDHDLTVDLEFARNPHNLVHTWAIDSDSSSYTIDGVYVPAGSTPPVGSIAVGIPVNITPETGFELRALTATYTNKAGIAKTVNAFAPNGSGGYYFQIDEAPDGDVDLKLLFKKVVTSYEVKAVPTGIYADGEVTVRVNNNAAPHKVTESQPATVLFLVRYNKMLDGDVKVSYGSESQMLTPTFVGTNDTGTFAVYRVQFTMPRHDVEVEYTLKDRTKVHVTSTDCTTDASEYSSGNITVTPTITAATGYKVKITATYRIENETKMLEGTLNRDGTYSVAVPDPTTVLHGINSNNSDRLNLVTIKAETVPIT